MPNAAKKQADDTGIAVRSLEYCRMPAMRFIGVEAEFEKRSEIMSVLDAMPQYASGFDYDVILLHHFGNEVDKERCHGFLGRFMKADTPFRWFLHFDFVPKR